MGGTDLLVRFIGLDLVSRVAERAGNSIDRLENRIKRSMGEVTPQAFIAAGIAATTFGVSFLAAAGAATAAAFHFVEAAAEFNSQMTLLHTHAAVAADSIQTLSNFILQLAPAVGFGPTELAKAMYRVESVMSSLPPSMRNVATAEEMLTQGARLAAIGHADLEATVKAVGNAFVVYQKQGYQVAQITGIMNAAIGEGDMRLQDWVSGMATGVLPIAEQAGVKFESLGAAIATLTDAGIPATRASTYLRSALIQMTMPSGPAIDALKAIGVATSDITPRMEGFSEVLNKAGITQTEVAAKLASTGSLATVVRMLSDKLQQAGLTAQQAGALMERAFGGIRSGTGMVTLYNNLVGLETKEKDLKRAAGDFENTWQYFASHDPAFVMKQLNAGAQALEVTIGNALMPVFLALANFIGPLIQKLIGWANAHQQIVAGIAIVVIAVTAVLGVLMTLAGFILIVGGSLGVLIPAIGTFAGLLGGIALGPFLGVLIAVGIALFVLSAYFRQISDVVGIFVHQFQRTHNATQAFYVALLSLGVPFNTAKKLAFDLQLAITKLHAIFGMVGNAVANAFKKITDSIDPATMNKLTQAAARAAQVFQSDLLPVLGVLVLILGSILGGVFKALVSALAVLIPGAIRMAADAINILTDVFKFFGDLFAGIVAIVVDIVHGRWDLAWQDAKNMVVHMVQDVGDLLGHLKDLTTDLFTTLKDTVIATAVGLVTGVIDAFRNLWHTLVGGSIVPDMINSIIAWFWRLPGELVGSVANAAGGVINEWWNLTNRGLQIIGDSIGRFVDAGWNMAQGVAQGIRNGIGQAINAAQDLANAIPGPIKSLLGISSPSRVMAQQVGLPVAQGVAMGILAGQGAVQSSLSNLFNGAALPGVTLGGVSAAGRLSTSSNSRPISGVSVPAATATPTQDNDPSDLLQQIHDVLTEIRDGKGRRSDIRNAQQQPQSSDALLNQLGSLLYALQNHGNMRRNQLGLRAEYAV